MSTATSRAFDRHCAGYSDAWDARPLVRSFRARVLARCVVRFPAGGEVLDLGCGPGTDARILTSAGFRVRGVDLSPEMVAEARRRGVDATVGDLRDAVGRYDGVLSDFGALDCVDDGAAIATMLRRVLPVGRWFIAVVMSPFCPAEDVALMLQGRRPFRRRGAVGLEGHEVPVAWWSARRLAAALGGDFRLVRTEALGALVPPPDLGGGLGLAAGLDRRLGALPLVRDLGDHTLCEFRRLR